MGVPTSLSTATTATSSRSRRTGGSQHPSIAQGLAHRNFERHILGFGWGSDVRTSALRSRDPPFLSCSSKESLFLRSCTPRPFPPNFTLSRPGLACIAFLYHMHPLSLRWDLYSRSFLTILTPHRSFTAAAPLSHPLDLPCMTTFSSMFVPSTLPRL